MPVFNAERYLHEAVDSILAQTYRDFELIISDNASTDGTAAICSEYVRSDPRVRYFRNSSNRGAAYNYNRTFELARGKYFKHAAYDDLLAPTLLERCVEVLEANPAVVLCYSRMTIIDAAGNPIQPRRLYPTRLHLRRASAAERYARCLADCNDEGNMCDPIFGVFRSEVLRKTPVIGAYHSSDMVLLAEISLLGEIHEVPETLFFERWHPHGSVLSNGTPDALASWFDPALQGKLANQLPTWRWLFEYLAQTSRVPLTEKDRLKCRKALLRWTWQHKRKLAFDVARAARYLQARCVREGVHKARYLRSRLSITRSQP